MTNEERRDTIIIADNNKNDRALLVSFLQNDFTVIEAENGIDGIAFLRENPDISLVLADVNLNINTLLSEMKNDSRLSGIPVIAVTPAGDLESQTRALEAGASEVLTKPYCRSLARKRVGGIIGLARFRKNGNRASHTDQNEMSELYLQIIDEPGGVAIFRFEKGFIKCEYLSCGALRIFGCVDCDITVCDPFFMNGRIFTEDMPRVCEAIASAAATKNTINLEMRIKTASCEPKRVNLTANPVVYEPNGELFFYGVLTDITENRNRREHLRISEPDCRSGIAGSDRMIYRYTVENRLFDLTPEISKQFGLPVRIENAPEKIAELGITVPESKLAWLKIFDCIDSGVECGSDNIRLKTADGRYRWFNMHFVSIKGEDGNNISAIISYEDITAQRECDKRRCFEREGLVRALSMVYPMNIICNITKNTFEVPGSVSRLKNHPAEECGTFDELIALYAKTIPKEERERFFAAFSRSSLLDSFTGEKNMVRLEFRWYDDGDVLHWIETIVLHIDNPYDGDVLVIALARIMDEQKAYEEKLRQALDVTSGELARRLYYNSLINSVTPGLIVLRYSNGTVPPFMLGNLSRLIGYTDAEICKYIKHNMTDIIYPDDIRRVREKLGWVRDNNPSEYQIEFRILKKNGDIIWLASHGTRFTDKDGETGYITIYLDITERRNLNDKVRLSEEELRLSMAQTDKMICRYDIESHKLTVPEEYAQKHGISTVITVPLDAPSIKMLLGNGKSVKKFIRLYDSILRGDCTGCQEIMFTHPDGSEYWESMFFINLFDSDGKTVRAVISIEDITPAKEAMLAMRYQAETDGLTELYNRTTVERMIRERLVGRNDGRCAMIMLDLDDFKKINDTFGHIQGDCILKEIAAAIKGHFRSTDIVGRAGGDEFIVFLTNITDDNAICKKLASLIKMLACLGSNWNNQFTTNCSAGCAFSDSGDTFETLFVKADTALYRVKRTGKNGYAIYTPDLTDAE